MADDTKAVPYSQLRLWLGMRSDDTEHDELIKLMELSAFAQVERLTGRYLGAPAIIDEIVSGNGLDALYLANPPQALQTPAPALPYPIVSVRHKFGADWLDPWSFLTQDPAADLEVVGRVVRWTTGSVWPQGYHNITISYWTGYPWGTIPDDLKLVILELVGTQFRSRSPAVPSARQAPAPTLSANARSMLAGYRRPGR